MVENDLADVQIPADVKGWLNTQAIRYLILLFLIPGAGYLMQLMPHFQETMLNFLPDILDPLVSPFVDGFKLILMGIVSLKVSYGIRAEAALAPTQIRGLVKKRRREMVTVKQSVEE